ncbi:MAG: hypothetical protein HWE27_05080 [Gammaproteobacteria bacterium]|nr:hypothetical protein [Gammaproteobacteria bacterium]
MSLRSILCLGLACSFIPAVQSAEFNWGDQCSNGSNTLQNVPIKHYAQYSNYTVTDIGEIPAGLGNISITVDAGRSDDIDIELRDKLTGEKIISSGLNTDSNAILGGQVSQGNGGTADYNGVSYAYSGFDGTDYYGKETFDILGDSNRNLIVSAVTDSTDALNIGGVGTYVDVSYSWNKSSACGGPSPAGAYIQSIDTREQFLSIAQRSSVTGAIGINEVKFVIMDINTNDPKLYFMNTKLFPYHYDFVKNELRTYSDLSQFNNDTYFFDERRNLAGTILAHDNYTSAEGIQGIYTVEFWPTDPVSALLTTKAYNLIKNSFSAATNKLVHFPASDVQTAIYFENKSLFESSNTPIITSDELFSNVTFSPLNLGEGFGTLRVIESGSETFSTRDVVIFKAIPNDLSHVGGIITDAPQTPLSHINLKAKQNNTPNAYIKGASSNPSITSLVGKVVQYKVTVDGYELREATQAEADQWFESVRPTNSQTPQSDLNAKDPIRLTQIGNADWIRYGAKAANVAELAKVLDRSQVPDGYAVPFSLYDEFMKAKRCEGVDLDEVTGEEIPNGEFRELCEQQSKIDNYAISAARRGLSSVYNIEAGSSNVTIAMRSPVDLDLVLIDNGEYVVSANHRGARLYNTGTISYKGLTITYSGYLAGNETITISGTTGSGLSVGAYGYQAGSGNLVVTQVTENSEGKSYYEQIAEIMEDEAFQNDPAERDSQLKDFRKEIKKGEVPASITLKLDQMHEFWRNEDGTMTRSVRLRSSTNNEDLEGFNGAGLYESTTHDPDEGKIEESAKKIWAALWTFRAFEERDFYRIDHFKTYMGILAHESYGDEQVNGVGVTKNIYSKNTKGHYINAQYGEISVTNPEPIIVAGETVNSIPDEFLLAEVISAEGYAMEWIRQYIRHSNVETVYDAPVMTPNVLTDAEIDELRMAMDKIQAHFKAIYNGDENFAMDIEFKITRTTDGSRGHLEIKQARPWVD